jgi:hypothetical protein
MRVFMEGIGLYTEGLFFNILYFRYVSGSSLKTVFHPNRIETQRISLFPAR